MKGQVPEERVGGVPLPAEYSHLLADVKARIRIARTRAALCVSSEMIRLYWEIGRAIVGRQQHEGWGAAVIDRLARDLGTTFPGAELQSDGIPGPLTDLPWGHNTLLVSRLSSLRERLWYAHQTLEQGWSRAVLTHQIDSGLYHRQGQAITNFEATLPPPDSDLAKRLLKDPYAFDFLDVGTQMAERKLEANLITRLQRLLLELGRGFAFVGSQYRIEVATPSLGPGFAT